jgi:hypothetical protein
MRSEKYVTEKGLREALLHVVLLPVVLFSGAIIFSPVIALGYQVVHWLKHGSWLPMPLSMGTDYLGITPPRAAWVGVQKVVDWILDLPLSLALFVIIVAAACGVRALWGLLLDFLERTGPKRGS